MNGIGLPGTYSFKKRKGVWILLEGYSILLNVFWGVLFFLSRFRFSFIKGWDVFKGDYEGFERGRGYYELVKGLDSGRRIEFHKFVVFRKRRK